MAFIVAVRMASIVLLAASAPSVLTNEEQTVPAGDWKYIEVPLHQRAARISASYEVLNGSGRVRMALMLRDDLERMSADLPGSILVTPEGRRGFFADRVRRLGDYVVVLDNQDGRQAARVRLRVGLDFGAGREAEVGRLTPRRQLTVVAISCVAFLGIVGFSAQRLLKSMRP
jgi:hypothetical protein